MCPFQGPGRITSNAFTRSYIYIKKKKNLSHFDHIWSSIIEEVRQLIIKNIVIFLDLMMFVVSVSFFKFVFFYFFSLEINKYSLSYLILYSFSQKGLQKLYKLQAPQNFDPPLIMSLSSCDFRKNGCERSHVLLNRVEAFLTYTLHFCQLSKNSVEETSKKCIE